MRLEGRDGWLHGWTMNLSQSGVLLALRSPADLTGEVEFVIRLSDGSLAAPGVGLLPDLHGIGTVVRVSPGPDGLAFAAAVIRSQEVHPRALAASGAPRDRR